MNLRKSNNADVPLETTINNFFAELNKNRNEAITRQEFRDIFFSDDSLKKIKLRLAGLMHHLLFILKEYFRSFYYHSIYLY